MQKAKEEEDAEAARKKAGDAAGLAGKLANAKKIMADRLAKEAACAANPKDCKAQGDKKVKPQDSGDLAA